MGHSSQNPLLDAASNFQKYVRNPTAYSTVQTDRFNRKSFCLANLRPPVLIRQRGWKIERKESEKTRQWKIGWAQIAFWYISASAGSKWCKKKPLPKYPKYWNMPSKSGHNILLISIDLQSRNCQIGWSLIKTDQWSVNLSHLNRNLSV